MKWPKNAIKGKNLKFRPPRVRKSRNLRPIQDQRKCKILDRPDMYPPTTLQGHSARDRQW